MEETGLRGRESKTPGLQLLPSRRRRARGVADTAPHHLTTKSPGSPRRRGVRLGSRRSTRRTRRGRRGRSPGIVRPRQGRPSVAGESSTDSLSRAMARVSCGARVRGYTEGSRAGSRVRRSRRSLAGVRWRGSRPAIGQSRAAAMASHRRTGGGSVREVRNERERGILGRVGVLTRARPGLVGRIGPTRPAGLSPLFGHLAKLFP
jgi:hypothetical protein